MNKLEPFPKENHERKQLEEIAHLYFSSPAPPAKASEDRERRERPFEAFSPFSRALYVHCVAGRPERGLSTWFLFNLAVMLKILNGPVLLIGSQRVYEKRFLFGFRPDRERLRVDQGLQVPPGSFGPMGLCLLDGRVLWRGFGDQGQAHPVDPLAGRRLAFRYILSDEVRSGGMFRGLAGLVVFLVTPATTTPALLDRAMGEEDVFCPGPGHVGIVVAGAGCAEEADALYRYWQDRIEEKFDRELAVENFGMLPAGTIPRSRDFSPLAGDFQGAMQGNRSGCPDVPGSEVGMPGMGILEDPDSAQTRFCRAAAALIRKKRSEWVPRGS